jgi:hypothetical protein
MNTGALSAQEFNAFEALVLETGRHTENECGDFLAKAAGVLLQETPLDMKTIQQDRSFFGASDLIITAKLLTEQNHAVDHAFIWELKAPQCSLMESDDNRNRFRPTIDLIKAETQLLHYASEIQNNDTYRERLKIMDRNMIKLGGIVIGTRDRLLRNASTPGDIERAASSLNIRTRYFYSHLGIRVFTWDRILQYLRP